MQMKIKNKIQTQVSQMKEYENSLSFWNRWFEGAQPEGDTDLVSASDVLTKYFKILAQKGKILDFGCGGGWASLSLAKLGANSVVGVDQAPTSIEYAKKCVAFTSVGDKVEWVCGDHTSFSHLPSGSFDGCFSSNTLDVIPFEVSMEVAREIHRLLHKGDMFLMMLNPLLTKEHAERIKMVEFAPKCFSIDGNLRCVNFTKEEWEDNLKEFFDLKEYAEFRFEGEKEEVCRRLFFFEAK